MRYMGSKRKIAKEILPIILKGRQSKQWYVEPFVGGCNTIKLVDGLRIGGDIHSELIAMYQALQKGWLPPKQINEDGYKRIMKTGPPELKGYAGFTHSFGGKFGSTYRRHTDKRSGIELKGRSLKGAYSNIDYVGGTNYRMVMNELPFIKTIYFFNSSYYDLKIPSRSIIYCDPPYAGTATYETKPFNSRNFFQWCYRMANEGHSIFVSEYSAPLDFKCVWQKDVKVNLNMHRGDAFTRTEKLFTL